MKFEVDKRLIKGTQGTLWRFRESHLLKKVKLIYYFKIEEAKNKNKGIDKKEKKEREEKKRVEKMRKLYILNIVEQ